MSRERPDLDALELLVRTAETGSLSRAARSVGVAQPNASRAIARLERELDLALIVRSPGGSTLTVEGGLVVEWAREALAAMERVVVGSRSLAAGREAHLTVAASLTIAEYLAPAWLSRLRHSHPDHRLTLVVGNSERVLDLVLSDAVALGFVECPSVPRSLSSTVVARDELLVVVHARHRWARRRGTGIDAAELVASDLVLREAGSGTRQTLVRALSRCGADLAQTHMELASTAAVKAAAMAGDAPAVLSRLAVSAELAEGTFVEIPVRGLDLSRRLRAVWRPSSRPTGAAADLLRQTREG
jgi:DNA-binding transcriptional LysR family regulator